MNNNVWWAFASALVGSLMYTFGLWRGNKESKRKAEEIKNARDSAILWEQRAKESERRLFARDNSAIFEVEALKRANLSLEGEVKDLKKRYADELQKRLELAELVQRYEQKKGAETSEAVELEGMSGEVHSGD